MRGHAVYTIESVGGPFSEYTCLIDNDLTVCVIGRIKRRPTSGRLSPGVPFSGFDTANTPFGSGHVIALSLGGSDNSKNLVPMWRKWQETGAWRKSERACELHNGHVIRVDLAYDFIGGRNRDQSALEFVTDSFAAWSDERIPTTLDVSCYDGSLPLFAGVDFSTLAGVGSFNTLKAAMDLLPTRYSTSLDASAMPSEDVTYWQNQTIGHSVQTLLRSEGIHKADENDFFFKQNTRGKMQRHLKAMKPTGFAAGEIDGLSVYRFYSSYRSNLTPSQFKKLENRAKGTKYKKTAVFSPSKPAPVRSRFKRR